jgi:hypothetical protein
MEENDYRMFLQNGKIFPVLDINSLDDADIMDKLERVVERFDGVYIHVNVGKSLPSRMKSLYSNNKRASFLCPQADVAPLLDFLDLAVGSSMFKDMVQGYVFSNIVPPLFRYEAEQDQLGNIISHACSCSQCETNMGAVPKALGAGDMVPRDDGDHAERFDFAQRIWLWATAYDRARTQLGEIIESRLNSYDRIMQDLSSMELETYLLYPETEYPDISLQVALKTYGIDDRWLDHFSGIIASPLFELSWDEEHIMSWNVDEGETLLRLKYLEDGHKLFIESRLSPEVMSRVLQG